MPLFPPTSRRVSKRMRAIQTEAFAREAGLRDIDAYTPEKKTSHARLVSAINIADDGLPDLRLRKGFSWDVKQMLSGTRGCTHLTGLAQIFPPAMIRSFGGEVITLQDSENQKNAGSQSQKSLLQLNRSHPLQSDGAAVAQYYPPRAIQPLTVSTFNQC